MRNHVLFYTFDVYVSKLQIQYREQFYKIRLEQEVSPSVYSKKYHGFLRHNSGVFSLCTQTAKFSA